MDDRQDALLDELLEECMRDAKQVLCENGPVKRRPSKRLMERTLEDEMRAHLGIRRM